MTIASWKEGDFYQEQYDDVASWMGICHGWAAAAIALPRPKKKVTLKSPTGDDIHFYPADIKALISLLYVKGAFKTHFLPFLVFICYSFDPRLQTIHKKPWNAKSKKTLWRQR